MLAQAVIYGYNNSIMSNDKRESFMAADGKRKTTGALGIVLALALTIVIAGGVIYGAYAAASAQPGPAGETAAAAAADTTLSVFSAPPVQTGEAPSPAPIPSDIAAEQDYDYKEILFDEDGLLVARIVGKRWSGYIAVIDDPMRVSVSVCPVFSPDVRGYSVAEHAENSGAVLAINGGGFEDPGGAGKGSMPIGNVMTNGELLWSGYSSTVGMDGAGQLHVGEFYSNQCVEMGLQWAVSYGPTLVENGEIRSGLDALYLEPRTAVGQRADGSIIFVVLQGRQPAVLGVSRQELAEIMVAYGAVNAGNLDGGASSDMYFQGEYVNVCNTSGGPRGIPTAVVVMPKQ